MAMKLVQGTAASNELAIDTNGCIATAEGVGSYPGAGGFYTVAGQTSAVVAAALAANTNLVSLRFSTGSARKAYVTKMRLMIGVATLGASTGVAGTVAWQRYRDQTPTGGTARTVNRHGDPSLGSASDMTDVRDSNAALTGTAPTWGNVIACSLVPLFITSGYGWYEWIYECPNVPDILLPGDGIGLRTQVAMAATQTWMYSYTVHWYEK